MKILEEGFGTEENFELQMLKTNFDKLLVHEYCVMSIKEFVFVQMIG